MADMPHPFRSGFCDGVFGRECKNPHTALGWAEYEKSKQYIAGYLKGQTAKNESLIKQQGNIYGTEQTARN